MWFKRSKNLVIFLVVVILILLNFYGGNIGISSEYDNVRSKQPNNTFERYIWGGVGDQDQLKYGWNLTFIENLNGDSYPDLVIGTPWYDRGSYTDAGAVYVFYGKSNIGFENLSYSDADVTIMGDGTGIKFGWDVADAGDVNGDGINDLIVGAPGISNSRGRAYIFHGGNLPNNAHEAARILDGMVPFGAYGSAVTSIGDVNNDGYDDVLVGAPLADQVVLTYGYKEQMTIHLDMWDDNKSSPGIVTFEDGVNNGASDSNTWGRGAGDDGWDWSDSFDDPNSLYYHGYNPTKDHATIYAPWEPDGPDADGLTWKNLSALEVMIGRNHTHKNPYINVSGSSHGGASAAWGVQFNLPTDILNYVSTNSSVSVSFDYMASDSNKITGNTNGTDEICIIASSIWNSSARGYLGDVENNSYIVDFDNFVFYQDASWGSPAWGPFYGHFEGDITDYIYDTGPYYWDFGCAISTGWYHEDDGFMALFDNISMKITNSKNIIIQGVRNSGFGTSVAGVGDINNDGFNDMMIGAPNLDGGHVALIRGKKRFRLKESANTASLILTGRQLNDRYGYSIAQVKDVDNDGNSDVIIGAPGGDYANLYLSSTLNKKPISPDLWEMDEDKDTSILEFDSGLKSLGNTPGISGNDDGWETWDGAYGHQSGQAPGSATQFNGAETFDSDRIKANKKLIISIGGHYGNGAEPDSGAYGVEFQVTDEMIQKLNSGGDAIVSYDWRFRDNYLYGGDDVWIRTFIRNNTDDFALGWELDTDKKTKEVYYSPNTHDDDSITDLFIQGCTEVFQNAGPHYFDLGARVESWVVSQYVRADGIFYFDNVRLCVNRPPDMKFIGSPNSGFGYSVGCSNKLNYDDFGDIVIGAPFYDSANGINSGAVFGFITSPDSNKIINAEDAEYIIYGDTASDNLGWALSKPACIDGDEYGEILVSAINYDLSNIDVGRVYILSYSTIPRVRLLYPIGGERLSGNVIVNATVTDPDNNIKYSNGVYFYYSTNLVDWALIGNDVTPVNQNPIYQHFEHSWNTSTLPDGSNYFVKAWVQDIKLNKGVNFSKSITIDNPHQPQLKIQQPVIGSFIEGIVTIDAFVKDSDLDLIGGGINNSNGVQFFFSSDKETWEQLGVAYDHIDNIYTLYLDTSSYPDGEYWLKVNATDWDGFEVEEMINITIDNPSRAPSIKLLAPVNQTEISGKLAMSATAFDYDGDINSSGITFMIAAAATAHWQVIGNDPEPAANATGADIYSAEWDSTEVLDDWYRLKAVVNDTEGLANESEVSEFIIHNTNTNPPEIDLLTPVGGQVVDKTQVITARVRDLENNIDPNGVFYYYSADKVNWNYIGNMDTTRPDDPEYYDIKWFTDQVPDGEYWLNASVSDTTNLKSWDVTDEPIIVHNSKKNPPVLRILSPTSGQYISGTFDVQVDVYDMEDNIHSHGVTFSYSTDNTDWTIISNVGIPMADGRTYKLSWDTMVHTDGKYWLKAVAKDRDGLEGEAISEHFFIHNRDNNPPIVSLIYPQSGEFNGTIKINASVFDLEKNLNEDGVNFYCSTDQETWTLIGNDPTATETKDSNIYEFYWDTKKVPDDMYWLRVCAEDRTELVGIDLSDEFITIHNNLDNPPRIKFLEPEKDEPLKSRESIIVEVIDFEDDVESVSFYYSTDMNGTWELIDAKVDQLGTKFKTIWTTEEVNNGKYYIKVKALDNLGNSAEIIEGPFKVTEGIEGETKSAKTELLSYESLLFIIITIIMLIIITVIIVLMLRKSKKREKELIEEVAAEVAESRSLEGEVEAAPMGVSSEGEQKDEAYQKQTYIPASEAQAQAQLPQVSGILEEPEVETIEAYKDQMEIWKAEGYNIGRLEQMSNTNEIMFAKVFPIFSANIGRLKNISRGLNSLDTTGFEAQVNSIKSKLKDPDSALAAESEFKDLEAKLKPDIPQGSSLLTLFEGVPAPGAPPSPSGAGSIPKLDQIEEATPQLPPSTSTTEGEGIAQVPPENDQTDIPPEIELPPEDELTTEIKLPKESNNDN